MERDRFLTAVVQEVMNSVRNTKAQALIIKLIMTIYDTVMEGKRG